MNKKGIELSVNFIVMFILGLVMLGVGMYILVEIVTETEEISQGLDRKTEQAIENALKNGNDAVYLIEPREKSVKRDEIKRYAFGIKNTLEEGNPITFRVKVECKVFPAGTKEGCDNMIKYVSSGYPLNQFETDSDAFFINPPKLAPTGLYQFKMKVTYPVGFEQIQYGSTKVFSIEVK